MRVSTILVPRPRASPSSSYTENVESAVDSHTHCEARCGGGVRRRKRWGGTGLGAAPGRAPAVPGG